MAGQLQRKRTRCWIAILAVLAVLSGQNCLWAKEQRTEAQILEMFKQKRLMRCPAKPSDAQCGASGTKEIQAGAPTVDSGVLFASASSMLDREARRALVILGRELNKPEFFDGRFLVSGHADGRGSEDYNQHLSARRALAVKRFLVEDCGVSGEKFATIGYGKQRLKNVADPFAAENRRVQIVNTEQKATMGRQ
ncbi:MAG: OmpA family protein [Planctomycetota bacterium]